MALMLPGGGGYQGVRMNEVGGMSGMEAAALKLQMALAQAQSEGASAEKVAELENERARITGRYGLASSGLNNLAEIMERVGGPSGIGMLRGLDTGGAINVDEMKLDDPYIQDRANLDAAAQRAGIYKTVEEGEKAAADAGLRRDVAPVLDPTGVGGPTEDVGIREQMKSRERQSQGSREPTDTASIWGVDPVTKRTVQIQVKADDPRVMQQKIGNYGSMYQPPTPPGEPATGAGAASDDVNLMNKAIGDAGMTPKGEPRVDADGVTRIRVQDPDGNLRDVRIDETGAVRADLVK